MEAEKDEMFMAGSRARSLLQAGSQGDGEGREWGKGRWKDADEVLLTSRSFAQFMTGHNKNTLPQSLIMTASGGRQTKAKVKVEAKVEWRQIRIIARREIQPPTCWDYDPWTATPLLEYFYLLCFIRIFIIDFRIY